MRGISTSVTTKSSGLSGGFSRPPSTAISTSYPRDCKSFSQFPYCQRIVYHQNMLGFLRLPASPLHSDKFLSMPFSTERIRSSTSTIKPRTVIQQRPERVSRSFPVMGQRFITVALPRGCRQPRRSSLFCLDDKRNLLPIDRHPSLRKSLAATRPIWRSSKRNAAGQPRPQYLFLHLGAPLMCTSGNAYGSFPISTSNALY
jgi:hypothetical protein